MYWHWPIAAYLADNNAVSLLLRGCHTSLFQFSLTRWGCACGQAYMSDVEAVVLRFRKWLRPDGTFAFNNPLVRDRGNYL